MHIRKWGLADKTSLSHRNMGSDVSCPWCLIGVWLVFIFFVFVLWLLQCGEAVCFKFYPEMTTQPRSKIDWVISYIRLFHEQDGRSGDRVRLFIATLWVLWEARNELIYRGVKWLMRDLSRWIPVVMDSWFRSVSASTSVVSSANSTDAPPPSSRLPPL